jgi:L-arabinokinase
MTDTQHFTQLIAANADFITPARETKLGRGPGRLDVMGGIADYSGSLVLQWPLARAAHCAIQFCDEPLVSARSLNAAEIDAEREVSAPLELIAQGDYAQARNALTQNPARAWAAYALGTLVVMARETGAKLMRGMRLLVGSDVPAGKGVSSSAALEVACMRAACELLGVALAPRELAILCQKAENLVVGAPCGVMDQMSSACGEPGKLLALRCQPAQLLPSVPLPDGLRVWGIDSGIRHAVSGSDYTAVRVGAFMGYRIIAGLDGLPVQVADGIAYVDDPRRKGYLANISPAEWEAQYQDRLPLEMRGDDFLAQFGGTTDSVTRVNPARAYAIRQPTAHPIYENARVEAWHTLLSSPPAARSRGREEKMGELMYQSHASYSACGLGSDGTDQLVQMAREAGPERGIYGAKITGGGSGGTVAVLARANAEPVVRAIAQRYAQETGRGGNILE